MVTVERIRDRSSANPHARGTTSKDKQGNSEARRRRKVYLLETYASDVQMIKVKWRETGEITVEAFVISLEQLLEYDGVEEAEYVPTARCYRCGDLVWFGTISVDRIVPGAVKTARFPKGGSYVRENIRPACDDCQEKTSHEVHAKARLTKAKRRNRPEHLRPTILTSGDPQ